MEESSSDHRLPQASSRRQIPVNRMGESYGTIWIALSVGIIVSLEVVKRTAASWQLARYPLTSNGRRCGRRNTTKPTTSSTCCYRTPINLSKRAIEHAMKPVSRTALAFLKKTKIGTMSNQAWTIFWRTSTHQPLAGPGIDRGIGRSRKGCGVLQVEQS